MQLIACDAHVSGQPIFSHQYKFCCLGNWKYSHPSLFKMQIHSNIIEKPKYKALLLHTQPYPWQWGNCWPFSETGKNFPTGGEIVDRFWKRSIISPPMESWIPLVGKLLTVSDYGKKFPHQWGNSYPFLKTVNNFPTSGIYDSMGGEIIDRFQKRSTISPPMEFMIPWVGKFLTVYLNGQQFPHRWGNYCPFK